MGQRNMDVDVGKRAYNEIIKLCGDTTKAAKALGSDRRLVTSWYYGCAPSAFYLERLHKLGIDIIYILTGRNNNAQN